MLKKLASCLGLILLFCTTHAAEKLNYSRKSISGPEKAWVNPQALHNLPPSSSVLLNDILQKKIKLPRFDYNTLPDYVFTAVSENLSEKTTLNEEELLTLFSTYAMPEIETILNNAEIQKKRLENASENNPKITFADTKGNAQNIQINDLEKFFNSAYIYFPYISSVKTSESDLQAKASISGGLVWYNIKDDGNGHKKLVHITTIESTGSSTVYKDIPKEMKGSFAGEIASAITQIKSKDNDVKSVKETAIKKAIIDWTDQLAIGTKKIDQFQLAAQIIETNGWNYTLNIGNDEGVELDSAYDIMDIQEENGKEILKPIGFGMITQIQNKKNQKLAHVTLKQQLGKKQTIGGYVKEYPRLWTHVNLSLGSRSQMKLKASEIPGLKKDITEGSTLALQLMKNMAPQLGISQFFIGIQTDVTFVDHTLENSLSGTPIMWSAELFAEKKFWYKSHALAFNIGYGYEKFNLHTSGSSTYDIGLGASHLSLGAKYEKQLTKNLSAFCAYNQRLSTKPFDNKIEENGIDVTDDFNFKDTRFGGSFIRLGLNYIIPASYKIR